MWGMEKKIPRKYFHIIFSSVLINVMNKWIYNCWNESNAESAYRYIYMLLARSHTRLRDILTFFPLHYNIIYICNSFSFSHTLAFIPIHSYLFFHMFAFNFHSIQVPSYMSEFVMVTAWVQENGMHLYPNTDIGGKYTVLSNGELYINNASPSDAFKAYTCRTVNRLTGRSLFSTYIVLVQNTIYI